GAFREDLYFRLGRPDVLIPALRQRPEEIPWHVERVLRPLRAHASLVETALLREWPGNVRELLVELREAARAASREGSEEVATRHIGARAGTRSRPAAVEGAAERAPAQRSLPGRDELVDALRRSGGNVTRAARALGTHRTQLRRWIKRYAIDPTE